MAAIPMIELWRGGMLESVHSGHAVITDEKGEIVEAWGNPEAVIFPRSSCKMIQALPLIESGAAEAAGLTDRQLALASASHCGARIHTEAVESWLADIGLSESDLMCGPQLPDDREARKGLICSETAPCRLHNNCSGKHAGFLTLARHLKADLRYVDVAHPVQQAVKAAFEDLTGMTSPGHGIDGCSAPNFTTTVHGLARAMSRFATAREDGDARSRAAHRLVRATTAHPEMVLGERGSCTRLMRAMEGRVSVKYGAEAVYVAVIPEKRMGIALKILDGQVQAAQSAITALLVRSGVLDRGHPVVGSYLTDPVLSRAGEVVGEYRLGAGFAN
ncbi:asparaginase [Defluviimonas sp. CAU 1641]|uniref:Asparaginase n=2 Tax=Defluviimonas salinarum TaxID=2992147 RepID=A0ABT3J2Z9_9RHOB|nr:asparaginase [Defluviimonas salinarum]